jgi:hypothetical protein
MMPYTQFPSTICFGTAGGDPGGGRAGGAGKSKTKTAKKAPATPKKKK